MAKKIIDEMEEQGKVLAEVIALYDQEQTPKHLLEVLRCLKATSVIVPIQLAVSDEDKEQILQAKIGDTISAKNDIRLKPDILARGGGGKLFPVFSQKEQMPEEYRQRFSILHMPFVQVLDMAEKEDLQGVVVDAFSKYFIIEKDVYHLIRQLAPRTEE